MSILQIRVFPDPILLQRSHKVTQFDTKLFKLATDTVDTMSANQGLGLAANQVGFLKRLIVIKLPEWEDAMTLLNPDITRREGNREVDEACLSLPGYHGTVNRSESIRVRFQDLAGQPRKLKAECTLAQAIEHETDHLNGIMFTDHLIAHDRLFHIKQDAIEAPHYLPTGALKPAELEETTHRLNLRPQLESTDEQPPKPADIYHDTLQEKPPRAQPWQPTKSRRSMSSTPNKNGAQSP